MGSSPRVRGAARPHSVLLRPPGIIPARAGSSQFAIQVYRCIGDHPRACGEQGMLRLPKHYAPGSSPRVRGAAPSSFPLSYDFGIIPARAGSSGHSDHSRCTDWDHPRACGEQLRVSASTDAPVGSSPRVRGAGGRRRHMPSATGIIPARAGSSCMRSIGRDA